MKKTIFILLFGLIAYQGHTQNLNFGVRSVNLSNNALNNFIAHYNDARPWLNNRLGSQNFVRGFSAKFESDHDISTFQLMFAVSYLQRRTHARGTAPNGVKFKRSVKSRIVDIGTIGASFYPVNGDKLKVGFGAFPMKMTWYSIYSKIDTDEEGWVRYSIPDQFSADDGVFGRLWMSGSLELNVKYNVLEAFWVTLSLHAQKGYFGPNFTVENINQAVNPQTHGAKAYDKRLQIDNWGFSIYISPNEY